MPSGERLVPRFEVDPSWPMLPNDWVLGSVASVDVASRDHVWIYHRPRSVDEAQQEDAAPAVIEFDLEGDFVQAWGGPGEGYDWPANEHGIEVDDQRLSVHILATGVPGRGQQFFRLLYRAANNGVRLVIPPVDDRVETVLTHAMAEDARRYRPVR